LPSPRQEPDPQPSGWDARLYDDKHTFVWEAAADLVGVLAPQPGERILDLGCGTGHLTAKIAANGAFTLGIDNAESMIAQVRRNYPALRFELTDARDLPYVGQFDAVFSNAVLHWVRPPRKAAASIWQALRPGGRLVAEFGGKGNVQRLLDAVSEAKREAGIGGRGSGHPWYYPSIAEYSTLLENQGFTVTSAALFNRPTPLEG
jgi:trans-aconitate methyltransferase